MMAKKNTAAKRQIITDAAGNGIAANAASMAKEAASGAVNQARRDKKPKKIAAKTSPAKKKPLSRSSGQRAQAKNTKPLAKPKDAKPKTAKPGIAKAGNGKKGSAEKTAKVLDSQIAFEGRLFRVTRDHIIEPGGQQSYKDVIRHNGSVVILATDPGKKKKDPWVVIERQYRHAAGQFLWELPAGKLDAGEAPLAGAKRELAEETGYQAKKWSELVMYFASPGFLGESMKVFLAEGLVAGEAHPEEDENIDFRLVKLSDLLEMIDKGKIADGKTLTSVLLYARQLGIKRKG